MPDTMKITSAFDATPVTSGMTQAADVVEQQTARMNTRFNRVGTESQASMNKVAFSSTEARHALHGLGEEMGVHIPRFVQTFVAHMGTLGPLLANAFSVIAVVGLLQVLAEVPEAINKIIAGFTGWDAEAKKDYAEIIAANRQLQIENIKLAKQMADVALIGKIGPDRSAASMRILATDTKNTVEVMRTFLVAKARAEGELHQLMTEVNVGALFDLQHTAKIEEKRAQIDGLRKSIEELEKKLREAPVKTAEAAAENVEQLKKAREEADNFNDELARAMKETAKQELGELTRLMNERERLEEEMNRDALEMAKRDLADFERLMIDKSKMQEDQARFSIEQTHNEYEEKTKIIAASMTGKGGDRAIEAEAERAMNSEIEQISKMIGLEEQLRQKLLALNVAQTDPRILDSERKQIELVQQANIVWQKYRNVVTQTAVDEEKQFRKAFDTISRELNTSVIGWMSHTESFGRSMMKLWTSIETTAINSLLRIGEQEVIGYLLHKTIADKQKLDDAKAAARGAFKWVMEDVPFPVNVVLAPAAAAAAFAGVMAFEQGGIMPRDDMAYLHANEMVLPASLSQKVQSMSSSHSKMEVHFHGDAAPSKENEDQIVAMVKRAQRRGRLP